MRLTPSRLEDACGSKWSSVRTGKERVHRLVAILCFASATPVRGFLRSCATGSSSRFSAPRRPARAWGCRSAGGLRRHTVVRSRRRTAWAAEPSSPYSCPAPRRSQQNERERFAMEHLLVVDDEPNVLYSLEKALRSEHLRVTTATTAAQGIAAVREHE